MQYAYARVRSIFAKGKEDAERLRASGAAILLGTPAERALGLEILRFSEALDLALVDYRPNQLTAYLFELANRYSTFFEECPVLKAPTPELRRSRLLLCDLTARTIRKGLDLLGIRVVETMCRGLSETSVGCPPGPMDEPEKSEYHGVFSGSPTGTLTEREPSCQRQTKPLRGRMI
jgi:hypothetical protein